MTLQRDPSKPATHLRRRTPADQQRRQAYTIVDLRDGDTCVMCDCPAPIGKREHSHRAHAGMGGSPASFRASNLLLSCGPFGCNYKLSHDANFAELGRRNGWLLARGDDPTETPLLYHGSWVLLDDNGDITDAAGITHPEGEPVQAETDIRTAEPGEALPPTDDYTALGAADGTEPTEQLTRHVDGLEVAGMLLAEAAEHLLSRTRKGQNIPAKIALAHALATHELAVGTRRQNAMLMQAARAQAATSPSGIVVPR